MTVADLSARLRGPWLDRELAAGVAPWHSPAHSARSLHITSRRERRSLARTYSSLLQRASSPPVDDAMTTAVPVNRAAVLEARWEIRAIVARLCDDRPVATAGVADLRRLLTDSGGPLYVAHPRDVLTPLLMSMLQRLDVPA